MFLVIGGSVVCMALLALDLLTAPKYREEK
jgi:hypothetical protein